jgi:superfamily II DNA or RNA helicase
MDKEAVTSRVIEEWRRLAGDRKTVVFASTVTHAKHVCESFVAAGVTADIISGDMAKGDRARVLADYEKGRIQVLLNVAVLTEGWDCQTVSCVILLRKCSYKGTMTQMIGRGLRKVDPQRHPGVVKSDCVIIDFGYSILNNGDLNTDVVLEPVKGKPMTKDCPECGMKVPAGVAACPVCEHIFDGVARRQLHPDRGRDPRALTLPLAGYVRRHGDDGQRHVRVGRARPLPRPLARRRPGRQGSRRPAGRIP